jgi:hypothetical protein
LRLTLKHWDGHECSKILNLSGGEDRELLVYGTSSGYLQLMVENHGQRLASV